MSLISSLNIGRSALSVNQAALQVTGNNIANAGNADYTRQVAGVTPAGESNSGGVLLGQGIDLTGVTRQIDEALQSRVRASTSDDAAATTTQQFTDRLQSVFNELGDQDLSTKFSTFFGAWSDLQNNPQDPGKRQIVIQDGQDLANQLQSVRSDISDIQSDAGKQAAQLVTTANGLAQQVADLNKKIALSEAGSGGAQANDLRDQRDAALTQLSSLVDISTTQNSSGSVNVFIGTQQLVNGTTNRGLVSTQTSAADGTITTGVAFKNPNGTAPIAGGQIGALMQMQTGPAQGVLSQMDSLAGNLINELNKVYSQGQGADANGLVGFTSVTGTNAVTDPTAALGSAASGLAFPAGNGSFSVWVRDTKTQQMTRAMVSVNENGTASDTTLNSLAASLNTLSGVSASITGGKLTINASQPGTDIVFSDDSSGALASLGINTFFTGSNAKNIAVNQTVTSNTALLAVAGNLKAGDNSTALAIANLQTTQMTGLGGGTLTSAYDDMVNTTAVTASSAQNDAEAAATVKSTLVAQRESLSGVDMNEEAVNLIKQQRAFQGAAKLVSAIDDMMKTVLSMVG